MIDEEYVEIEEYWDKEGYLIKCVVDGKQIPIPPQEHPRVVYFQPPKKDMKWLCEKRMMHKKEAKKYLT